MTRRFRKRKLASDLARVAIVMAMFGAVAFFLNRPGVRERLFDIDSLRATAGSSGWQGVLWFIGIGALLTGVGIPRLWISAGSGALFGALAGSIIGHVSSLVGATLNFYIARILLRGPVKRHMPARWHTIYEKFNENGFRWLLYMRLFPLSNATVTNVVGGISGMTYSHFFAATFLGYLPLTVVFALFGSSAAKRSYLQLLLAAAIFVAVLLGRNLYEKYRRGTCPNDGQAGKDGVIEEPGVAPQQ